MFAGEFCGINRTQRINSVGYSDASQITQAANVPENFTNILRVCEYFSYKHQLTKYHYKIYPIV